MTAVFEKILEMSLTSAVVIAVVVLIRLCLRKAPRKYSYVLWSVAAFRLVCPVSFKAVFSLFTLANRLEAVQVQQTDPLPATSPGYFDSVPPGYFDSVHPGTASSVEIDPEYFFTYPVTTPPGVETPAATVNWMEVAAIVWLIGLAALLIYGIVSYIRLRRRMSTAVLLENNIWQSDRVQSPFILGFVRPKIYLPFGLTDGQRRYVLAHERYHLKRLDHIVRPLSYLILAVHWFNPLVWLAYYLMARDMEMSCDEKVLSTEENIRKEYSTTLLSFAANRRFPSPSPLAFGESGVKGRIKNALNWKKPRTWVTVIAVIVCIVVIVVCAANPKEPESTPDPTPTDTEQTDPTIIGEGWDVILEYQPYDSVDCLYMNPLSSVYADDSGERWFIGTNRVTIYNKNEDTPAADFAPAPVWQILMEYNWEAMFQFAGNIPDISGYENILFRTLSEEYALVRADGELWAVETRGGYIWAVWRMEPAVPSTELAEDEPVTLAVWQVDLTHDGVDETVTVRTLIPGQLHDITVTKADGTAIWGAEAHYVHAGHNGIYLYEHNGLYYLMRWNPYMSTGTAAYGYKIFGLNENGMEMKFSEGSFGYGTNTKAELLALDIDALRAFEGEVNALLADAIVLLDTNEFEFSYSTPEEPVTRLWTSPADELERRQQIYLAADAKRDADTLAVWPLNDLTVTVLKTELDYIYALDVYWDDYFFWSTELHTFPQTSNTYYMVYRENGTEYLAEFTGTTRQAVGLYSYRVFSVGPESLDILYENSIQYEFMSAETSLCVDLGAIEAFQNEVNTLFKDADIICAVENGEFAYAPGGTDSAFRWVNPDLETLTKRKQGYLSEMPLVVNNLATDKGIEFLWAINDQIKLRLGENSVARVTKGEEIPTGAVGTTSGDFLWQITYLPGQYHADSCSITWQGKEVIYVITHEDWSGGTREWQFVAALDEEELQSRFNTEEMLAKYNNDPYLAAVVEITNLWRAQGGRT